MNSGNALEDKMISRAEFYGGWCFA